MSTKRLARELGLIRKRSRSSSIHKRSSTSNQFFSYLIVIDFESTCWREKNDFGQEIIEFPAVLLNAASGETESEFHSYVQPQERPVLSSFCTELTGITQERVEAGLPLPVCLSRFARWIQGLQREKGVAFLTQTPPPTADDGAPVKHCSFVTWSDWDLGVCLLYECKRKQITKPEVLNSWIDLRAAYRIFYNRKPKGLNGALQDLGITFSGREHSGLDDARNTARLAWRMIGDGCVLKTTRSLSRAPLRSGPSTEQGRGHKSACTDAARSSDRTAVSNTHPVSTTHTATTTHSSVCRSLVRPRTVLSALTTPGCVHTTVVTPQTHPEAPSSDGSDEYLLTEAESGSYDDVVLEDANAEASTDAPDKTRPLHAVPPIRDPHRSLTRPGVPKTTTPSIPFSIYIDQSDRSSSSATFRVPSAVLAPSVNQSARRTGSSNQSAPLTVHQSVHLSSFTNQSALNSISVNQSASSVCSINQSALSSSSINQSRSIISGNQSALSSSSVNQSSLSSFSGNQSALSSSSSVNHSSLSRSKNQSALSSSSLHQSALCFSKRSSLPPQRGGVKITSPLCDCGRRSKRLTVCNGGPNQGRAFYTCAVRRSSGPAPLNPAPLNPAPRSKGCGFFKWESALVKSSLPIGRNSSSLSFSVSTAASRSFR
ncbi:ERI1 exoribonuclease 2 [Trichomycterus rosablanca]|uniref:ERI1 exoribonuclease 2 n=1 Tax=Trichomycterus rosablanca TaxID=2290929 RepID=UPI002F359ED0